MNRNPNTFRPSSNRLTAALLVVLVSGFGMLVHAHDRVHDVELPVTASQITATTASPHPAGNEVPGTAESI